MNQQTIRVLLVEDNPGDARLISRMLSSVDGHTFDVHHVRNLRAGIERLQARAVDVLLLDLGLPDNQGLECLAKVKNVAPDVPVLVFTGSEGNETILDSIKAGARDYFVKSRVKAQTLVEAILRETARRREFRDTQNV